MLKEFRKFALKGNMLDLAIGVVLGVAFGAVVASSIHATHFEARTVAQR